MENIIKYEKADRLYKKNPHTVTCLNFNCINGRKVYDHFILYGGFPGDGFKISDNRLFDAGCSWFNRHKISYRYENNLENLENCVHVFKKTRDNVLVLSDVHCDQCATLENKNKHKNIKKTLDKRTDRSFITCKTILREKNIELKVKNKNKQKIDVREYL